MTPAPARRTTGWFAVAATIVAMVCAMNSAPAGTVRQVTDRVQTVTTLAGLDDAGTVAFAFSSNDPSGTDPDAPYLLVRYDLATGESEPVTTQFENIVVGPYGPSVSDDGTQVAFLAFDDPLGANADGGIELFLIGSDGTGIVQLTDHADPFSGDIGKFALSGDGGRVVFESNIDYLESNPSGIGQLFVVETDGTGLRQVTSHTLDDMYWMWPDISDDGTRISYMTVDGVTSGNAWQIFGVLHDGTGRRQITDEPYLYPALPTISGDGSTIAFETQSPTLAPPPGGCYGSPGQQVAVVGWEGTDLHLVTGICLGAVYPGRAGVPALSDDGQTVYYAANEFGAWNIEWVNRDGTGRTFLTDVYSEPGPRARCTAVRAAGGGGQVAYWCDSGEPWGGPNKDLSRELYDMTGTGTGHRQLSRDVDGDSLDPDITPDGATVVFASDANLLDEPGYWHRQLYRMNPDGSGLARITSFDHGSTEEPSVSDDGSLVVFAHDGDPLGTNGYRSFEIFAMGTDGTGLVQLTPDVEGTFDPSGAPDLSGDGSVVVFQSLVDLLREGIGGWNVYRVDPDGANLARISPNGSGGTDPHPRVDGTGTWAVHSYDGEIHRVRTDGSADAVISPAGGDWPDVASGGGLVVYASDADPLGTNLDGNPELFLWEAAGGVTTQLTETVTGSSTKPSFDRAATWIYFWSDAPHLGEDQVDFLTQFRVQVASGIVERVGGLESCVTFMDYDDVLPMAVDGTGRRAAFHTSWNCDGNNRDGSIEIVLIDRDAPASIHVSAGPAPTTVSWDVESGPVRYDVIRGGLDGLAGGAGTIDLGAVVCVEDDSTDATTAGDEEPEAPAPGHGFFYLYRGSQGAAAGPGSYGAGSGGGERLPADGDCPAYP